VTGTGRREARGIWWTVFARRHVACGVLTMAGGVWWPNHDVGPYHGWNLIFSAATEMTSHDASRPWC